MTNVNVAVQKCHRIANHRYVSVTAVTVRNIHQSTVQSIFLPMVSVVTVWPGSDHHSADETVLDNLNNDEV